MGRKSASPHRFVIAVNNHKTTGTGASALLLAKGLKLLGEEVLFVVEKDGSLARSALAAEIETMWPLLRLPNQLKEGDTVVVFRSKDALFSLLSLGMGVTKVRVWSRLEPPKGLEHLLGRFFHLFVLPSHALESMVDGVPSGVLPGGVDISLFQPRGLSRKGEALKVGMVARLKPGRGHQRLLKASAKLPFRHQVVLVGDGEAFEEIDELARRLNLSSHLTVVRERVKDYPGLLSSFDLLVYLSPGSDATCRTVFEAMACGVPVVAAAIGDLEGILEGCGIVVREKLEGALLSILSSPRMGMRMGRLGVEKVKRSHTLEKRAHRLKSLLKVREGEKRLSLHSEMAVLQLISRKGCDSGGGLQALQLAWALKKRGIKAIFSARGGGSCQRRSEELGVPFFPFPMRGEWDLSSLVSLILLLRREGIALVHVHKGLAHSLALFASVLLTNPISIVANRGVSFDLEPWNCWRYQLSFTRAVVAVSHSVKQTLVKNGLFPEKVRVVPGSVDLQRFSPSQGEGVRRELEIPEDAFLVGFIAAMRPWKNHVEFARLVAPLMQIHPNLHCLFAGKEKPKILRAMKRIAREAGVEGRFHFLGYREDPERIIAACDLTVNLSSEGEGMPGVLRESLACGVPVLATPVAGNPEVVLSKDTGVILKEDGGDLPKALALLKSTPRLRRLMGRKGRSFVEKNYSVSRRIDRMLKLYQEAVGEGD